MNVAEFLASLEGTGLANRIRDSLYLFPMLESFHVIGLALVFGTIAIIDLRLLGIASTRRPFTRKTCSRVHHAGLPRARCWCCG